MLRYVSGSLIIASPEDVRFGCAVMADLGDGEHPYKLAGLAEAKQREVFAALVHLDHFRDVDGNHSASAFLHAMYVGFWSFSALLVEVEPIVESGLSLSASQKDRASKERSALKDARVAELAIRTYEELRASVSRNAALERTSKVLAKEGHDVNHRTLNRYLRKHHPDLS
jgi:hypothetical protein